MNSDDATRIIELLTEILSELVRLNNNAIDVENAVEKLEKPL